MLKIIRKIISPIIHWKGHFYLLKLRIGVIIEGFRSKDKDKIRISLRMFRSFKIPFFPYDFPKKYSEKSVDVFRDEEGYPYVWFEGKKLFFKKDWTDEWVKKYYVSILRDIDQESPHSYFSKVEFYPKEDDVIADLGAAEGVFSLKVISSCKKVYLFEADKSWTEPLERTFRDYKEKIEIVNKYIGKRTSTDYVSIDDYFRDKEITYIKADIEGAEEDMIMGGYNTLCNKIRKALVCTYHLPEAETRISNMLNDCGYKTQYNDGYVLFIYNLNTFKPPYIRHALVIAEREKNEYLTKYQAGIEVPR